ncbi:MAG: hypothetical protein WA635_09335, partial [Gallionella sp.]
MRGCFEHRIFTADLVHEGGSFEFILDAPLKSLDAREAYNSKGLVPRVVAALKKNFPELGVMTDIAL